MLCIFVSILSSSSALIISFYFCRLLENLKEKLAKTNKDIEDIESALWKLSNQKKSLTDLQAQIINFYVFDANLNHTAKELNNLRSEVETSVKDTKNLVNEIKNSYIESQQIVPSDISQELTVVELLSEDLLNKMEDKDREFKKARTVRTDYIADVEEVQNWIKDAELKVRDRSIEPQLLNEHLHEIQSEIGNITDRLEKLIRNGKIIIEKTRDEDEKKLVQSTIDTLTNQMQQVKTWLEEKKQQIGDTLDAWQRFLTLYQAVLTWVNEKRIFLKEPLYLSTLQDARQKLHDYNVRISQLYIEINTFNLNHEIFSECCEELQRCFEEFERYG